MIVSNKPLPCTSTLAPPGRWFSEEHEREIVQGSGISRHLARGRYFTVTTEDALALGFSQEQAGDGWVVELVSPTGEVEYQLKRNRPRAVIKNGTLKPVKYETRAGRDCVVDVHSSNRKRLQDVSVPLLAVEGAKKGDCAASRGRLALVLAGVWNWGKKRKRGGVKYGRPELLPDWDAIPLEGRKVFIAFDEDYREKRNVALAMMRFAERLTERGAHVYIISLPGPEKGLDDYVVAGGDLDELERAARPYQACDFTPYVATENQRVRKAVALALRRIDLEAWEGKAGKTDHSNMRAKLEMMLERGRWNGSGVEVIVPTREMQERAGIGSRATLGKSDARLEERGYISKTTGDRSRGKANRYHLNPSELNHVIGEGGGEGALYPTTGSVLTDLVPHLRWSSPPPPEDEPTRAPNTPMFALGKAAELALYLLASWDGRSTVRDLASAVGFSDPSKFRARVLEDLAESGVVDLSEKGKHAAVVSLPPDWRTRLDARREEGGEFATSRRQAVKHREGRESFRSPLSVERTPAPLERGKVQSILQNAAEKDEAARLEEQRRKVGTTAEVFVHDRLVDLGRVRMDLLKELWAEQGGKPSHVWFAVRRLGCKLERLPEHDNALFVFPPKDKVPGRIVPLHRAVEGHSAIAERPNEAPAPVVSIKQKPPESLPEPECDGSLGCSCFDCSYTPPRYARPYAGNGVTV